MPEAKTKRRPPAKKATAARKPHAASGKRDGAAAVKRTQELSDDVIKSLDDGARAAIDSVRKFVETVDRSLPSRGGETPSRREEITDSALEMAQKLVHTQAEFLRKVVDSAAKSVRKSDGAK